jgi:tetratricopeptide (TPR) repeat protein
MTNLPKSQSLFRRVATRMRLASFGVRAYIAFLAVTIIYGVGLLASRLLGVLPGWFDSIPLYSFSLGGKSYDLVIPSEQFLLVPLAALAIAGIWLALRGQVTTSEAARKVDTHRGTKDLFLTLSMLDKSVGEYGPLVAGAAEQQAPSVRPALVVPFNWQRRLGYAAIGAMMVALIFNVPQLDPFGTVAEAKEQDNQRQNLAQIQKANKIRIAQLEKELEDKEGGSPEVKKAIEGLKNSFRKAKANQQKLNRKMLAANQKDLGKKYQKIRAEKLKNLLSKASSSHQFGRKNDEMMRKWSRELQEGSTDSLQKEFEKLKDDLKRLSKTDDPIERAELMQKLQKRMKAMEKFASEQANSKTLAAALQRAQKQLEMLDGELSEEARKALQQSLELSKLELEELAQSARDLKQLEQALKTLQMARKLNQQEKLDGEMCEGCSTLADYEELYREMMAESGMGEGGEGDGEGTGGRGMGQGGKVDEDDSVETGFKAERSKSQIVAGKVLLSLKSKGISDSGDAKKNYLSAINRVKQGVSEAIETEQVPPGYHDGIKSYFDKIDAPIRNSNDGDK